MLWNKICSIFGLIKTIKKEFKMSYKVSLNVVRKANESFNSRVNTIVRNVSVDGISVRVNKGRINKTYTINENCIRQSYKLAVEGYGKKV